MKIVRGFLDVQYPDVAPEIAIDRGTEFLRCERPVQEDMGYLSFGVDSGISPARTMHSDAAALKRPDHTLKLALDRAVVFLHLPTVEISAIVLDSKLKVHSFVDQSV